MYKVLFSLLKTPVAWHQIEQGLVRSTLHTSKLKFLIFCTSIFLWENFQIFTLPIIFHDSDLYLKHFMTLEITKTLKTPVAWHQIKQGLVRSTLPTWKLNLSFFHSDFFIWKFSNFHFSYYFSWFRPLSEAFYEARNH